jgi:hypothetical protein
MRKLYNRISSSLILSLEEEYFTRLPDLTSLTNASTIWKGFGVMYEVQLSQLERRIVL